MLGKGNSAEIGGGNEENGKVKQLASPENKRVFGAEFIKCHVPDSAIVAAGDGEQDAGGRGGGVTNSAEKSSMKTDLRASREYNTGR